MEKGRELEAKRGKERVPVPRRHTRTLSLGPAPVVSPVDCLVNFLIDITLASESFKTCKATTISSARQGAALSECASDN